METFHVKLYGIWTNGSEDVVLTISYLELLQPLCSADRNHLCNFNRMHIEEQFCEIIFNVGQWCRRKCCLQVFLILRSRSPFDQQSVTIYAILVEGIMRNDSVKLF